MTLPAAGELNRRILIKKRQDMPAMGGGISQTYDAGVQMWAKHVPVGTAIFFGTKQVGEDLTDRFIVRRTSTLNEKTITGEHVVEWDGQRYRVKRASDLEDARTFIMLETENLGSV